MSEHGSVGALCEAPRAIVVDIKTPGGSLTEFVEATKRARDAAKAAKAEMREAFAGRVIPVHHLLDEHGAPFGFGPRSGQSNDEWAAGLLNPARMCQLSQEHSDSLDALRYAIEAMRALKIVIFRSTRRRNVGKALARKHGRSKNRGSRRGAGGRLRKLRRV